MRIDLDFPGSGANVGNNNFAGSTGVEMGYYNFDIQETQRDLFAGHWRENLNGSFLPCVGAADLFNKNYGRYVNWHSCGCHVTRLRDIRLTNQGLTSHIFKVYSATAI